MPDITELEKPLGSNFDRESVLAALEAEPEDDGNAPPARATAGQPTTDDATRGSRYLEEVPADDKPQEAAPAKETPVTPAPGNEQQVDESGNPIGPVPYDRFKEVNDKLKSYETDLEQRRAIDPAFEAVAEFFGTRDPAVIAQAIKETQRQQAEQAIQQQIQNKWNENAAVFGEDAANVMAEVQRQQLQTQAQLNQIQNTSRAHEVERSISTIRDLVKDPTAVAEYADMVKSTPTEYLPTLEAKFKRIVAAVENNTRAQYASRKEADAKTIPPVTTGGRPPAAPVPDKQQSTGGAFSFSNWMRENINGNNSA